jgi:hypothetical protein
MLSSKGLTFTISVFIFFGTGIWVQGSFTLARQVLTHSSSPGIELTILLPHLLNAGIVRVSHHVWLPCTFLVFLSFHMVSGCYKIKNISWFNFRFRMSSLREILVTSLALDHFCPHSKLEVSWVIKMTLSWTDLDVIILGLIPNCMCCHRGTSFDRS